MYSFVVYLYVNGSGSITLVGEERADLSDVFLPNYVVSAWRGFLFLWVLGMGYVILLWHSLSLPYSYSGVFLYVACFGVSFCTVSPYVCLDGIYLGVGGRVAAFWDRVAHSVNHMFPLYNVYLKFRFRVQVFGSDCART